MYPLAEGLFAPKNQWYIAAWGSEVTRTPMQRMLLDEPVAFYRREDGSPVAVEGRCPHRSFPLGQSRVVGDNIQCGYHGITFRPDGSCAVIPSQAQIPNVCKIRAYPLAERWEWIWIWMGDPALADESLIPDHFEMGLTDPAIRSSGGTYNYLDGRYMLLHDNLFDLTHISYLHLPTFGAGGGGVDAVPVFTEGPGWIESRFHQKNIDIPPAFSQLMNYTGKINRAFGLKLFMPGLHYGADDSYRVNPDGSNGEIIGSLRVFHAVTPATRTTTHYFFAVGHDWADPNPDSATNIRRWLDAALAEDMFAIVEVEKMVQHYNGRPPELLLRADNVCARGRRAFERVMREELKAETSNVLALERDLEHHSEQTV